MKLTQLLIGMLIFAVSNNCFANQKTIIVDLKNFSIKAYDASGEEVLSEKASGGRKYCPDIEKSCKTPSGTFYLLSKKGPWYRSPTYPLGCNNKSKDNKCAKMAWAMKFSNTGEAFHASNDNWEKPKHISHGCVHLKQETAKWLNQQFIDKTTKIIILPY